MFGTTDNRISLKALRVDRELKQKEVAESIGVSKKTLGAWENGSSMPSLENINKICTFYGVSYDVIRWQKS